MLTVKQIPKIVIFQKLVYKKKGKKHFCKVKLQVFHDFYLCK